MWFKVDDKLTFHSKVVAAGDTAMGLWVRAGAWASAHETDGEVPKHIAKTIGNRTQIARLVEVGLWVDKGDFYQFHDWLDCNPSHAERELEREQWRERQRRSRRRHAENRGDDPDVTP